MAEKTKRYWWLKLREDFFDQTTIKKLRRMAGGDTYTIIYLRLQLLSLRNDGTLVFESVEDTFEDEIALRLDEKTEDVQVTILYLQKHGLIEDISETERFLPDAVKNTDSESDSAARMRNLRERKGLELSQCDGKVSQSAHSNVTCDTEIEIELEKELEKELELDIDLEKSTCVSDETANTEKVKKIDYKAIVKLFNSACPSLPVVKALTDKRRNAIKTILSDVEALGGFASLFELVQTSDYLSGRSGKWMCSFDWILNRANMVKVFEGNYNNQRPKSSAGTSPDYSDTSRYENQSMEV